MKFLFAGIFIDSKVIDRKEILIKPLVLSYIHVKLFVLIDDFKNHQPVVLLFEENTVCILSGYHTHLYFFCLFVFVLEVLSLHIKEQTLYTFKQTTATWFKHHIE